MKQTDNRFGFAAKKKKIPQRSVANSFSQFVRIMLVFHNAVYHKIKTSVAKKNREISWPHWFTEFLFVDGDFVFSLQFDTIRFTINQIVQHSVANSFPLFFFLDNENIINFSTYLRVVKFPEMVHNITRLKITIMGLHKRW